MNNTVVGVIAIIILLPVSVYFAVRFGSVAYFRSQYEAMVRAARAGFHFNDEIPRRRISDKFTPTNPTKPKT